VRSRPFEREVRLAVVGGVLFLLLLAGLSLVVLRNVVAWGKREAIAHAGARSRTVVERLQVSGDPALSLGGDAGVAKLLGDGRARYAALYDSEGNRLGEAGFLPDAALAPRKLPPESRPRGDGLLTRDDTHVSPPGLSVSVGFSGGRRILAVLYDGSGLAEAVRNERILSWVVPVSAVVLSALLVPFFRRLMRPIDALTETARGAGDVVRGPESPHDLPGRDETERALLTFQRTIEALKRRTSELEEMREREQRRADDLALRAETLVVSASRLERELSSQRELARLGEMSAGIAHEFRNATATILGYARLAAQTEEPAARSRHLAAIGAEAEHVARVTGDFLFFARPERLELLPTALGPLLAEIAAEQRQITPGVAVEVGGDFATAPLDAALYRRAIVNLLRNAVEAARTRVVLRGEGGDGGVARVAVEDDGAGVPPEALPKLFVPFFSTKEGGTGLGLALVAKIAALHGGSVSAERSAALGGARFVLSVPVAPPAA
jgi:signal transduction histidine kinase